MSPSRAVSEYTAPKPVAYDWSHDITNRRVNKQKRKIGVNAGVESFSFEPQRSESELALHRHTDGW